MNGIDWVFLLHEDYERFGSVYEDVQLNHPTPFDAMLQETSVHEESSLYWDED